MSSCAITFDRQLTDDRRYKLLGYIDLLEKSIPNGACAHAVRQEITILRMALGTNKDISNAYEERVKSTVRRLYPRERF